MSRHIKYGTAITFQFGHVTTQGIVTGIAFDCPILGLYYIVERWKKAEHRRPISILVSSDKIVETFCILSREESHE